MESDEVKSSNTNITSIVKKRGRPPKNIINNITNDDNNQNDNIENIKKDKLKKPKEIKVKKNIEIIKNPKQNIIKIKSDKKENKSMKDALEDNEVMLWGLNQIDSILLKPYIKDYLSNKKDKNNDILKINNDEKKTVIIKTQDKEFNPNSTYTVYDYDFLNKEYERIDKELSQMVNLDKKYENLLDLQDMISELIYDFEPEAKKIVESENNNIQININNDNDNTENSKDESNISEPDKNSSTKGRKRKFKPYYFIGKIPDGFREATQEEAILNKKVSHFGKYKVSRELYNIYDITGTLCLNGLNKKEIGLKIFALKGKMRFYQKEYEFHKISLNSGKLSIVQSACTKEKMQNISECYKKTFDVLNFYIKNFKNLDITNTDNKNYKDNKKHIYKSESSKKIIYDENLSENENLSIKKIKKEILTNSLDKKIKKNKSILNKN